jgi:hypothetical protein
MEPSEKKIGKNFADFVDRRYKPEKPMIFKIFYPAVYEGLISGVKNKLTER